MKVVQINTTCGSGSTGKICVAVSHMLTAQDVENYIMYASGRSEEPAGRSYMQRWEVKLQALKSRVFGTYGFHSKRATARLLSLLEEIRPDVVHMHNLHGHNVHLERLFAYLKKKQIKVFWTFHDCWAFTGYCPYFDLVGCEKWKTACHSCPQRKRYSWFFDKSRVLFQKKKTLFADLDMTIVTPSNWLAGLVKQSFLQHYPVKVIHNGIDLSVFTPTDSDFRKIHRLENKFILLGVSFNWEERKGLDVFIELAKRLDQRFCIVLVGTDDGVDKRLPDNILSIHRTQNQCELAKIYTAADLFVNPTREENFPTVHMESIACGTPVLTFDTGGSGEMLDDTCGAVVPKDDVESLFREIVRICEERPFSKAACMQKRQAFDQQQRFAEYVRLYQKQE